MNQFIKGILGMFLIVSSFVPLYGIELSFLDQIMQQAKLIVDFENQTVVLQAKKQLAILMNDKKLHPKIKEVINDDIEIIKKTSAMNRKASQDAYKRLLVVAKQVAAHANVVAEIEAGAGLVKNKAQEEQSLLWRLYGGAKRMITASVNYIFGEESSKAKTAFYTTVGAAALAGTAYGLSQYGAESEKKTEFEEFIQKFAPPLNVQETIDSHKDIDFGFLKGKDELSNVFAKGNNYSRLFNAERMRNVIESNNFAMLAIPKKWLYKVNGQWRVYAQYIPGEEIKKITREEIKELVEFAEQTGYRDWWDNIVRDKRNGKITIIDTEDNSFKVNTHLSEGYSHNSKFQCADSLYVYYKEVMDDEAKEWFDKHMDHLKHSAEGTEEVVLLPWSGQFDDSHFDFERIKEELEKDID